MLRYNNSCDKVVLTVAGTPSNCRPPWLETMMPCTSCFKHSSASSFVRIPLSRMGRSVIPRNHFTSSQVFLLIFLFTYDTRADPDEELTACNSFTCEKFSKPNRSGNWNFPFTSAIRLPEHGVLTVRTIALNPHAIAFKTNSLERFWLLNM